MFDAFARFYDADMGTFGDDLPFYAELARRTDAPILDAMCGTGRVIVPLAERGHHVAGLDISPAMLRVTQTKARARGVAARVQVTHGDIRHFALGQQFGLVLVPLNSFMHLETVDDQIAALRCLGEHVAPDGLLVLDLFNPTPHELTADQGVLVHDRTFTLGGDTVHKYVVRRTDWAAQHQDVQFIYDVLSGDGALRRHVLPFGMRWLFRWELEHVLARTGFVPDAWYGDYELNPYGSESAQLIVVARRA